MTDVAFSEGWLPRNDRGWKPLPQELNLFSDKMALCAMARY